jgi:hypothetical protein
MSPLSLVEMHPDGGKHDNVKCLAAPRDRRQFGQTVIHVRRDKAALFQGVQAPPGDRSSQKQPGQAWR